VGRFWPTIKQATSEDVICDVVEQDNETPPTGLPLIQKVCGKPHRTRREADETTQHWATSIPPI
jgi:hypothetical protein